MPLALPCSSVLTLPRSPTWRSVSEGAPCCLLKGLTERRRRLVRGGCCVETDVESVVGDGGFGVGE